MSDNLVYGYKSKYWRCIHKFQYTGASEEFHLDAGEYLLLCFGAKGGMSSEFDIAGLGGASYGILTLTTPTTLYATVGGDGVIANGTTPGVGGFNGGGSGGPTTLTTAGNGGGGASDIRIGTESLFSRVIVAGGAGGGTSNSKLPMNQFGGGVFGGPKYPTIMGDPIVFATQNSGYSFGDGEPVTLAQEYGNSGGGGGWFGGYANNEPTSSSGFHGGGGSGYVLTDSSYKPEDYLLGEEYHLTDTYMCAEDAMEASVIICEHITKYQAGDILTFPSIGQSEPLYLIPGGYKLKCWGGAGGSSIVAKYCSPGGYAEGKLTITSTPKNIFVNTGGCGCGIFSYLGGDENSNIPFEYNSIIKPSFCFNGGGVNIHSHVGGGGASDIRIGTNSLFSRVIVAGGAGGCGSLNRKGGVGGGETGGLYISTLYGVNSGPGTQTESPQNENYPEINGGFGFGGNGGYLQSGDKLGGPGGGGWFGGSGTYPVVETSTVSGGCGGSGYVLTDSSYKPEDYLLGEEYYLTDTSLVSGNVDLPIQHTLIQIEVLNVDNSIRLLCHDATGYKYFNGSSWIYFMTTLPTNNDFIQYGVPDFTTTEGLLDNFDVLVCDVYSDTVELDTAVLGIVPPEQCISTSFDPAIKTTICENDSIYDKDLYNVHSKIMRVGSTSATINTYIEKKSETKETCKVFFTRLCGK